MKTLIFGFIFLFVTSTTLFAPHEHHPKNTDEVRSAASEDVLQVLDSFRTAIINNDRETAATLLTDDVRILESGGIETREEYLSHHFHSDGVFLSAIEREVKSQKVQTTENTAWASTVSHIHGTYNDKDISLNSAELAVLVKTNAGWKITSLHWSSRSAK